MFDRFTERTRQVIVLAQEEARGLNHPAIGTEHILLGIIREKNGVGAQALAGLGFNLEKTRATIVKLRGRGPESATREQIPFSAPAKTVLEQALREALDLNHTYISTEHLLLGLLYSEETMVYKIFEARGVKPEEVRAAVMQYLTDEGTKPDKGKSQTAQKMKNLEKYGRDLTALAEDGKLDPVIGRETEVERIMQILSRRTKNNPVLLGEPGVGKTAVVEGLAQMLVKGNVPSLLEDKRIFALDLASLVAGTKYRGEFEQRLKKVMEAVTKDKDIILFIDEIHNLIGAGGAEGALDAASIVKPLLARGELQTIGATTLDEFRKYFERDAALERRFQQIKVPEPSVEDTVLILEGLRDRYEQHHSVRITDDALQAAAELADRYISDRFLPDKAIDLIDEAASRTRLKALISDPRITEIDEQLASIRRQIELAISEERFEDGADLKAKERELRRERETIELSADEALAAVIPELGEEEIAEIVSMWTGVPVFKLTEAETKKLIGMEEELHKRVIGQEVAITAVSKAIRRSRAGIKDPKRPTGSFIFLGPSGVGKTELARTLAEFLFGDEEALVRIDMSEYMESHSVSRLVGSPPGYIGHDEGGQLTEAVRRKPYSVLLLDEIEKAHPDVFNILLQILEDGRLTDSQGRTVDFRNTIIIMTSNIGAKEIARNKGMGFTVSDDELGESYDDMKKRIMSDLKRVFRPEFLNRIDEVIVFHKLSKEEIREIIDLLLVGLRQRLAEHSLQLELSDEAADFLADVGFDATMGARPLRRAIQRYIEDPLADEILAAIESFDEDGRPEKRTVIVERVEDPDDDADPLEIRVVEGPLAAC